MKFFPSLSDFAKAYKNNHLAEDNVVLCPSCGASETHISDVSRENLIGNQGAACILFRGECGHSWAYIFDAHKGETRKTILTTDIISAVELNSNMFRKTVGD